MYFRARSYDPETGEFISRDPLEYVDGMSLYRGCFVPGNVDSEGLWSRTDCTGISAALAGSAYVWVGGGASISISGQICNCCDAATGKLAPLSSWDIKVSSTVKMGVGGGVRTRVGGSLQGANFWGRRSWWQM